MRVTTTPNSAVVREPLYSPQPSRIVNGHLGSSITHFGKLVLRDENQNTILAEIWQDCPGMATARVEVCSCSVARTIHFFRLRIRDRAEVFTLLRELSDRIEALQASGVTAKISTDSPNEDCSYRDEQAGGDAPHRGAVVE